MWLSQNSTAKGEEGEGWSREVGGAEQGAEYVVDKVIHKRILSFPPLHEKINRRLFFKYEVGHMHENRGKKGLVSQTNIFHLISFSVSCAYCALTTHM